MTKIKLLLLFIITALLSAVTVIAEEKIEEPLQITADYACVYNVESGEMLFEKGANTVVYPAALVKIMTSVLALEYYQNSNDTEITVTESALETLQGNNIKLKAGEEVSFYDMVAAVAVGGANDAALVLAETVAGSVDKFVEMMNDKARSLGATHTQYANPTGYHSPRMYTTLTDMTKICEWASKNSEFMKLSSSVTYTMPATNMSKERTFTNSNLLLDPKHWLNLYMPGTSGMSNGMTQQSGYSLATVYNNDGQTNILIMVGGKIDGWDYIYFKEAINLIESTAVSYGYRKVVTRDEPVFDVKVLYGKETDHVLLVTKNEVTALIPKDALDSDITSDFTISAEECIAPVKKGTEMGSYNVYYQGEVIATVPLITMSNVKRDLFAYLGGMIRTFFAREIVKSTVLMIFSLTLFILVISFIVHYYRKKRRLQMEREERLRRIARARRTIKQKEE